MNRRNICKSLGALPLSLFLFNKGSFAADRPLRLATTFSVLASLIQEVAGDLAEVVSITAPGEDIHSYQPTPRDLVRMRGVDCLYRNGLGLELWFEKFFNRVRGVKEVVLSEGVQPIAISSGHYKGHPNPHAWISPRDASIYIKNIELSLTELIPDASSVIKANAADVKAKLDAMSASFRRIVEAMAEERRWLVTSEGAFSYLARDMGLKELYLWPINSDQQGTPQQVRRVIDRVRANNIPVIFSESTMSDAPARQVAAETGIRYGGVLYVDSLTEPNGPAPGYLELMQINFSTLERELGR